MCLAADKGVWLRMILHGTPAHTDETRVINSHDQHGHAGFHTVDIVVQSTAFGFLHRLQQRARVACSRNQSTTAT